MKKIVLSSYLSISAFSLSFRPLKDVYSIDRNSSNIIKKINSLQEAENLDESVFGSFYVYDKSTSILLCEGLRMMDKIGSKYSQAIDRRVKPKLINLLNSYDEKSIKNTFAQYRYGKIVQDEGQEGIYNIYIYPEPTNVLKIEEQGMTLSGVKIENTDRGVILSRDGKSTHLQTALKLYGESSLSNAIDKLAAALTQCYYQKGYYGNEVEEELIQRENVPMTRNELNSLNNCTILSVTAAISKKEIIHISSIATNEGTKEYYLRNGFLMGLNEKNGFLKQFYMDQIDFGQYDVLKNEDLMKLLFPKSVLVGLAKDNHTGKVFYWITDLKQDVSVLMKYAVDSSSLDKKTL